MQVGPGSRLGNYQIVSRLGAGGIGEVWLASDRRDDRHYAIKILPAEFAQNTHLKVRFEREAEAITKLEHPNICRLLDVGENFLVMELLDGETLRERLTRGPMAVDEAVTHAIAIAESLAAAHDAGIVHRDVKPGNIMITRSGVKLLDLGLARWEALLDISNGQTLQKKPHHDTPAAAALRYLPPEQLSGAEIDPRGDIFSFGSVLYEMIAGRPAFQGNDTASIIGGIFRRDPPPLRKVRAEVPALLEKIVTKCLHKRRSRRFQSASDLADILLWVTDPG